MIVKLHERRKQPLQARSHRLVETILNTTADMLSAEHNPKVTTNAVAEAAGISVGSLYRYFSDRDALIGAVIEQDGRAIFARIKATEGARRGSCFEAEIAILVEDVVNVLRRHPHLGGAPSLADTKKHVVFDRRAGAILAITHRLEALSMRADLDVPEARLPLLADVIHALTEAALKHFPDSLEAASIGNVVTQAVITCLTTSRDMDLSSERTSISKVQRSQR